MIGSGVSTSVSVRVAACRRRGSNVSTFVLVVSPFQIVESGIVSEPPQRVTELLGIGKYASFCGRAHFLCWTLIGGVLV